MLQSVATALRVDSDVSIAPAAEDGAKRLLDLSLAALFVLLILPILIVIALLIFLETGGPVLFRQQRGGVAGRPFTILKFRTMTTADDGDNIRQARFGDPRVTRVGAFLRKTSLDELPQLFNVIQGDMSLVGPRPHALSHDREFQKLAPGYERRFAVKPGMTGLAQIRGFRGELRHVDDLTNRVACDLEYVETWSFWSDLKILVLTLKVPIEAAAY